MLLTTLSKKQRIFLMAICCALLFSFSFFIGRYSKAPKIATENSSELLFGEENKEKEVKEEETEVTLLYADVKGAVVTPGIYPFKQGDRIAQLIEAAGGLTEKADRNRINLAVIACDAMDIYVPEKGEVDAEPEMLDSKNSANGQSNGKININSATSEQLQTISGIGPSTAEAIIIFRKENGSFKKIEDIKKVSGIGDKTFEKIKDFLSIS